MCLAGIIIALITLSRHRTVSLLALGGFGVLLVWGVVMAFAWGPLFQLLQDPDGGEWLFQVVSLATDLPGLFGLGLVVAAAFVGRDPATAAADGRAS